jgi:hypothetical protein
MIELDCEPGQHQPNAEGRCLKCGMSVASPARRDRCPSERAAPAPARTAPPVAPTQPSASQALSQGNASARC